MSETAKPGVPRWAELGALYRNCPELCGSGYPAETAVVFDWDILRAFKTASGPAASSRKLIPELFRNIPGTVDAEHSARRHREFFGFLEIPAADLPDAFLLKPGRENA
jgi:hypothetical protein